MLSQRVYTVRRGASHTTAFLPGAGALGRKGGTAMFSLPSPPKIPPSPSVASAPAPDEAWVGRACYHPLSKEHRMPTGTLTNPALAQQLLDALDALSGLHAGFRAAHAKGLMCTGTFTP